MTGCRISRLPMPLNDEKVYIYKGRTVWPSTLSDTQADYVISTDSSYAGKGFGFSMARLGDFTGDPDHVDDFAIGVRTYNGGVGRVVIIPGQATGFASVTLAPNSPSAIVIDGDSTLGSTFFGYNVVGLGAFYSGFGNTLIVSAPGSSIFPLANPGHVYAFHGQTGTGGVISVGSADNVLTGPASGARIGEVLTNLGNMYGSFNGVGIASTGDTVDIPGGHGGAYLMSDPNGANPFADNQIAYVSAVNASGGVLVGGGLPGTNVSVSLIGNGTADLVCAGQLNSAVVTISDGSRIAAKGSPLELGAAAEVQAPLPAGWSSGEGTTSIIQDINGDGVADFCIGSQAQPGAVVVYW